MGDRLIPNRSLMDMELAHSLMVPMDNKMTSTPTSSVSSPSRDEYRRRLKENMMLDSNGKPFRMLVFGEKPSACRRNRINEEDLLLDRLRPTSRNHRLPKLAGQVLNAKNLLDDYYANILDWGKNNLLAIALGSSVYIRNQATGKARLLLTVNEDLPTSVSWSGDGKILAVGFTSSRIMLWDVAASRRVGTLMMHEDKVGSLCWNNNILTSGSRDTFIINHDVRILERSASYYHGHSGEVCGLRWSECGNLLASGGNDKLVHVWEASNTLLL